LRKKG
jgi:hypothetical protein